MKNLIVYSLIISCTFITSGCNNKKNNLKVIESNYIDSNLTDMSDEYPKDSLNIEFGVGFKSDYICVFVNDIQKICDTVNTDSTYGFAASYNFGPLSNIKTVGIKINNGLVEKFELKKGYRFLDFYFKSDTLNAVLLRKRYMIY